MNPTSDAAQLALGQTARPPAAHRLRSFDLAGSAGRLEAVLNEGAPSARFAALVCHPHPLGGGNLHNKVVYHAMKVLNDSRWGFELPVLRFNFRGTGSSQGAHDGHAEVDDVLAALYWLENEFNRPIIAAGFSFGAAMTVSACCSYSTGVHALAALGLPVESPGRVYAYPLLSSCTLPKLFLSGDRDQFASAAALRQIAASAADPKQLTLIHGADHFFTSHLPAMQSLLAAWLKEQLS